MSSNSVKVDIAIPTVNGLSSAAADRLANLSYPVGTVHIERQGERLHHKNDWCERYLNIAATRNKAREAVLKKGMGDFILFLDDDVIPPVDVIEHLLFVEREVAGGWYPFKDRTDRWVAGQWVEENTFKHCGFPRVCQPDEPDHAPYGIRQYDPASGKWIKKPWCSGIAPLGCILIEREVAATIPFRPGIEDHEVYYDWERKAHGYLGECGAYADDLNNYGSEVAMSHRVVCEHRSTSD